MPESCADAGRGFACPFPPGVAAGSALGGDHYGDDATLAAKQHKRPWPSGLALGCLLVGALSGALLKALDSRDMEAYWAENVVAQTCLGRQHHATAHQTRHVLSFSKNLSHHLGAIKMVVLW